MIHITWNGNVIIKVIIISGLIFLALNIWNAQVYLNIPKYIIYKYSKV